MSRIVHVIPYKHLIPPMGGGALRCFHLLQEMAKRHEVHAILHQSEETLRRNTNGYKVPDSVRIYSTEDSSPPPTIFDKLPRRIGPALHYRWLRRSWMGPANGTLLRCYHLLQKIIQNNPIDCVVYEHLSSMSMAPLVHRRQPYVPGILDAHNVDHKLVAQVLRARNNDGELHPKQSRVINKLRWIESHLHRYVSSFWACSNDDKSYLESLNRIPGYTIPNGVDTDYFSFDKDEKKITSKFIIFSASFDTFANIDALDYLVNEIWPLIRKKTPQLRLLLVGDGMTHALRNKLDDIPSVDVTGRVPDVRPYYKQASIAIVPLRIGSGTRIKILEGMSQGNPVVSTTKGAEGLDIKNHQQIILADSPKKFAHGINQLLTSQELFTRVRQNARVFIEKNFSWETIGEAVEKAMSEVMEI